MKIAIFAIAALLSSTTLSAKTITASASSDCGNKYSAAKAFDHDLSTRWAAKGGAGEQTISARFEQERKISKINIIEMFDRIDKFKIEYKNNNKWTPALEGNRIGGKYSYSFTKPIQTAEIRITILKTDEDKGANFTEISFE